MTTDPPRRAKIEQFFQQQFGASPSIWARAPGRVDLMGSHTDYNLGYVLTLPIGRDTWIAAAPREDETVSIASMNLKKHTNFIPGLSARNAAHPWSNYLRGVAVALHEEGLALRGFNGVIHSTVPMSSGLSSSAALECVTATVFEALGGWKLEPVRKALLCQRAENQFVGVKCGILDQYTSCVGREGCALVLDCRDLSSRPVKLAEGIQVVICDTRYKRELAGSEYGKRRADCERGAELLGVKALREVTREQFAAKEASLPTMVAKRCRFIIEESERVLKLAEALTTGDRVAIGQLTADSFRGASELYEITAPAMHTMMAAMRQGPGVIGARQTGAGFGGCMVAFVEQAQTEAFAEAVGKAYFGATRVRPEIYPVEAAAGAGCF